MRTYQGMFEARARALASFWLTCWQTTPKLGKKAKTALDSAYSYLGGNAFGRDKRGRVTKDDAALTSEIAAAGLGSSEGSEYTPYVYYEIELP